MVEKQESITAKLCSFARAFHSNFGEKKIFDDYLAFDLMGKNQYEEMGQLIENGFDGSKYSQKKWFCHENIMDALYNYILPIPLSRISFAEKELADFASKYSGSGKKIQYVICGAGMDSFAFRNTNENIHVFEIDHPDTQKYKKERINELEWMLPKNLTFVPVDFTKDSLREKLLAAKYAHLKKILVPKDNRPDIEEMDKEITEGLEIVFVSEMEEVLAHALCAKKH